MMKQKQKLIPFLLELGVEELPAPFISRQYREDESGNPSLMESPYEKSFRTTFFDARIKYEALQIFVTPRRIVFAALLEEKQEAFVEELRGPSYEKAFDQDGKPSRALQGFLKGKGVALKDTEVRETNKGKYLFAFHKHPQKKTKQLLKEILPQMIANIRLPKNMKWDQKTPVFARPIRWTVCYFGEQKVSFQYGAVKSGAATFGHRFLSQKKLKVESASLAAFKRLLKSGKVVLDEITNEKEFTEREAMIWEDLQSICQEKKVSLKKLDRELIQTQANLVEFPFVFVGEFDQEYLSLPEEVLSASMKKHQKVLACYHQKTGKIQNYFIGVCNGRRPQKAMKTIIANNENVLEARLRDAAFFYREDTQTSLESKVEALRNITFLGKLGSVYDKTQRLIKLAEKYQDHALLSFDTDEKKALQDAALLCKSDLTTQMVFEFPELQGIMGRNYAKYDNKSEDVASAIFEHYLPRSRNDALPATKVGAVLAIFDKIDTLCGAFSLGMIPSGSQDPYALRRAAIGIVRILRKHQLALSFSDLLEDSLKLYQESLEFDFNKVKEECKTFLLDKVHFVLQEKLKSQVEKQILLAVLRVDGNLPDMEKRLHVLLNLRKKNKGLLENTIQVLERTQNILKNNQEKLKDFTALTSIQWEKEIEGKLARAYGDLSKQFDQLISEERFDEAIVLYENTFSNLIHDFFDQVLVNDENEEVRINRKSLLFNVNQIFSEQIADLSLVSLDASD